MTVAKFGSIRAHAMLDLWNTLVPLSLGRGVVRRVAHGFDSNHRITFDAAIIRGSACGPLNFSTVGRSRNEVEGRLHVCSFFPPSTSGEHSPSGFEQDR